MKVVIMNFNNVYKVILYLVKLQFAYIMSQSVPVNKTTTETKEKVQHYSAY